MPTRVAIGCETVLLICQGMNYQAHQFAFLSNLPFLHICRLKSGNVSVRQWRLSPGAVLKHKTSYLSINNKVSISLLDRYHERFRNHMEMDPSRQLAVIPTWVF